jgi:hypothetical protein
MMDGLQRSRAGKGVQREEKDDMRARAVSGWRGGLMGRARTSAGGGEELGYRFRSGHSWASGLFFGWDERFAPASFIYFLFFSLFPIFFQFSFVKKFKKHKNDLKQL